MSEPLLTLFTAPKSFKNPHIITIQRNALKSWQALGSEVEILVMGNDEGIAEQTQALGIRHLPNVACNSRGTPLVSSMPALARENSSSPFFGIVNADIILFEDVLDSVHSVARQMQKFLVVGQRYDMEITTELAAGREAFINFKNSVKAQGILHPPMGSDYFLFPRECFPKIPDFAIGRAGWDNWFIFKSRFEGWAVVDGTQDVTIVHQNHDYHHLPGGQPHYRQPETRDNVIQGGGEHTIFTLFDAQYELADGKLTRKKKTLKKILRELEILPLTKFRSHALGKLFFLVSRPRKAYAELKHLLKPS